MGEGLMARVFASRAICSRGNRHSRGHGPQRWEYIGKE